MPTAYIACVANPCQKPIFNPPFLSSPFPLSLAGLTLVPLHGVQHDLAHALRRMLHEALAPVVAARIGKHVARAVEIRRDDGLARLRIALEAVFGVLVPEVKGAVAAGGGEGAVDGVKADGVDGVDVADVVGEVLAMALEGEVGGVVLVLDVLDGAAALDAANGVARGVGEAGDDARLPLEGGLHGLVPFLGLVEIDDVDPAFGRADDEQLVAAVHGVDAVLTVERGGRLRRAEVPVLDLLVPPARHQDGLPVDVAAPHAADRRVVGGDLLRAAVGLVQVEHARGLVRARADQFRPVARPRHVQHGALVLVHGFREAVAVGVDLPDAHFFVPGTRRQQFGGRREGERGDGVVLELFDFDVFAEVAHGARVGGVLGRVEQRHVGGGRWASALQGWLLCGLGGRGGQVWEAEMNSCVGGSSRLVAFDWWEYGCESAQAQLRLEWRVACSI